MCRINEAKLIFSQGLILLQPGEPLSKAFLRGDEKLYFLPIQNYATAQKSTPCLTDSSIFAQPTFFI